MNEHNRRNDIIDIITAILYLIIIIVSAVLCIHHGKDATVSDLVAVSVSIIGACVLKIVKHKDDLKNGLGEIAIPAVLSACAIVALANQLFFR